MWNGYFCTSFFFSVCWIWQANRHEIRLIHTIVLKLCACDAHVTSTWTFHSVITAGAAQWQRWQSPCLMLAVSYFSSINQCIAHIMIWKENAYGSSFFFIRIKFCCITNRHFISTCIFDIHTHTTPESERILMCRIPRCLGCTLRTFRQRPAANLWLYAIMIIYYTTNECAQ